MRPHLQENKNNWKLCWSTGTCFKSEMPVADYEQQGLKYMYSLDRY